MKSLPISNALLNDDLHCAYLKHTTHPTSTNDDSRQTTGAVEGRLFVRHTLSVFLWTIITDMCHTFEYFSVIFVFSSRILYLKKKGTLKNYKFKLGQYIRIRKFPFVSVHLFILSIILWNIWYVTDRKPVAAGNGYYVTQFCTTTWTRNFICRP
jgi:hypothetical protein